MFSSNVLHLSNFQSLELLVWRFYNLEDLNSALVLTTEPVSSLAQLLTLSPRC